jgi:serine/threonine protein kinase
LSSQGSLPPGTRLGPYELVALIGRGGGGEVYRAHDARLGRDVAVKTVRGGLTREEVRRLEVEARATAALSHTNIVAVYDVGSEAELAYVVTELLDGENLRAVVRRGPIPPALALDYARQIADALVAAHAKNIVHRDLKPENVFVLPGGRIKVLDFGLAKQMVADPGGALDTKSVLTIAGEVVGTPAYFAPEQARAQAVDQRTDIFSFGAVLHEMLSGTAPFRRDTLADTLAAVMRDAPPPLPAGVVEAVPGVDRIVSRCLDKDPAARFQTAADLRFALDAPAAVAPAPRPPAPRPVDPERLSWREQRKRDKAERRSGVRKRSPIWVALLVLFALRYGWSVGQKWMSPSNPASTKSEAPLSAVESIAVSEGFASRAPAMSEALGHLFERGRVQVKRTDATHLEVATSGNPAPYVSALKLADTLNGYRFADEPCVAQTADCAAPLFTGAGQSRTLASIDVQGASASGLLQWIATSSGWPVVFDGSLKGSVDLSLRNVPWDFIVRSCLELQGLDLATSRFGDVWIASSKARASEVAGDWISFWVVRPQHIRAADLEPTIRNYLTDRGALEINKRLGAVMILDQLDAFRDIARVIAAVDRRNLRDLEYPRRPADYSGTKMSIDFVKADLRAVVRAFTEVGGSNVVLNDSATKGKTVTASLHDVRWDNALAVILSANGMTSAVQGNAIVLTPSGTPAMDLQLETIPLVREDPSYMVELFNRALSRRGSISISMEPKTVVIRDTPASASRIAGWVRDLDHRTR